MVLKLKSNIPRVSQKGLAECTDYDEGFPFPKRYLCSWCFHRPCVGNLHLLQCLMFPMSQIKPSFVGRRPAEELNTRSAGGSVTGRCFSQPPSAMQAPSRNHVPEGLHKPGWYRGGFWQVALCHEAHRHQGTSSTAWRRSLLSRMGNVCGRNMREGRTEKCKMQLHNWVRLQKDTKETNSRWGC